MHGLNLPEYFTIKENQKHPQWSAFINWLIITTGCNVSGTGKHNYGIHKNKEAYNYPHELQGEPEITMDDWARAIKGTPKLTNNAPSLTTTGTSSGTTVSTGIGGGVVVSSLSNCTIGAADSGKTTILVKQKGRYDSMVDLI